MSGGYWIYTAATAAHPAQSRAVPGTTRPTARLARRGPWCRLLRPRQNRHRQVERPRLRPAEGEGARLGDDVFKAAYAQLVYKIGGADEQQMARIRDYVAKLCKGWKVEQVRQIVSETLHELIHPYIYAEAAALIEEHRDAGRDVILVSASGDEMVRPIGDLLGATDVIATRMVVEDGHYTGEVAFYAAGAQKVAAVREMAEARGYDLDDSYAYSDSVSDVPLLAAVGHPTA